MVVTFWIGVLRVLAGNIMCLCAFDLVRNFGYPAFASDKSRSETPGKMGSGRKFYHNIIPGADVTARGR